MFLLVLQEKKMPSSSFDRFMERLMAMANTEWRLVIEEFSNLPTTLAVMRWHYETNATLRLALTHVDSTFMRIITSPIPEPGTCDMCVFARGVTSELARHKDAAAKTDLREASASAKELIEHEVVMRGFVALASSSPEIEKIVTMAMRNACKAFNQRKFLVVPPK